MSTVTRNRVEVLHGVNLDMLGGRDRDIYGDFTLPELEVRIKRFARELSLEAAFFQTQLARASSSSTCTGCPSGADAAIDQRRGLDPLLLGDPRRARPDRHSHGRGPHLRHLQARGVATPLGLRGARADHRPDLRQGRGRLRGGPGADRGEARAVTPGGAPRRAGRRARARPAVRLGPDQRPLPDRASRAPTAPAWSAASELVFFTDFRYTERAEREVAPEWERPEAERELVPQIVGADEGAGSASRTPS